uniref:C2H2-type domain-containing protein n=1 Tax=Anopheles atroparvus TaxID=41427 RepID=A0A182J7S6_ANOAO
MNSLSVATDSQAVHLSAFSVSLDYPPTRPTTQQQQQSDLVASSPASYFQQFFYPTAPDPGSTSTPRGVLVREFQSPLDLSLRPTNVPMTPPSTPSPPRKRLKSSDDAGCPPTGDEWRSRLTGHAKHQFSDTVCIDDKRYYANTTLGERGTGTASFQYFDDSARSVPFRYQPEVSESEKRTEVEELDAPTEDDGKVEEFIDITGGPEEGGGDADGEPIEQEDGASPQALLEKSDCSNIDVESLDSVDGGEDDDDGDDDSKESINIVDSEDRDPTAEGDPGRVLSEGQRYFEDERLHLQAIEGFARLFERSFAGIEQHGGSPGSKRTGASPRQGSKPERRRNKTRKQVSLDEDNTSPVSGTIIRKLQDGEELVVRKGDIDPAFNVVEITDEAKAILAKIENKIGSYLCQLCRALYDDAFGLAQHRCSRIVHIEYRCSECDKVFNCPANLASHKRWHKPRGSHADGLRKVAKGSGSITMSRDSKDDEPIEIIDNSNDNHPAQPVLPTHVPHSPDDESFPCGQCGKTFRRQSYLKKHAASHQLDPAMLRPGSVASGAAAFGTAAASPNPTASSVHGHHPHHLLAPPPVANGGCFAAAFDKLTRPLAAGPPSASSLFPFAACYGGMATLAVGSGGAAGQNGATTYSELEKRRWQSLGELYLQQRERLSAFQYVRQHQYEDYLKCSPMASHQQQRSVTGSPLPTAPATLLEPPNSPDIPGIPNADRSSRTSSATSGSIFGHTNMDPTGPTRAFGTMHHSNTTLGAPQHSLTSGAVSGASRIAMLHHMQQQPAQFRLYE